MATIRQQIDILIRKGMIIKSYSFAKGVLKKENYYNVINAYKDLFLDSAYMPTTSSDTTERYRNGVEFEELYSMFEFDRSLRELFLKYFLIVENQFKTHIAYEFSLLYGENGYLYHTNFDFSPSNASYVVQLESIIQNTIFQNFKTERAKHFYSNNKHIPIWVLVSFFEIGKIRKFFINCKCELKEKVAKYYGINFQELISMISTINMFRNVCAHDNRLYCYKLIDKDKQISNMPIHENMHISTISSRTGKIYIQGKNDLFACVISLRYLLSDELFSNFFKELCSIIDKLDENIKTISMNEILTKMGFPLEDSEGQLSWKEVIHISKEKSLFQQTMI